MSTSPTEPNDTSRQSDLLLWVAAAAVAVIGGAWLVISKPWASGSEPVAAVAAPAARTEVAMATPAQGSDQTGANAQSTLDNPLRMAKLAYDAGMLVEPEEYSAWTLYSRVLKSDPKNSEALAGLTKIADELVRRGETALEQGRFDDARGAVERIRTVLPAHAGAKALADKIWPNISAADHPSTPKLKPALPVERAAPVAPVKAPEPPKPTVDPLVEANKAFEAAMAASHLLTPADQSAKHYLAVMVSTNKDHALTQRARQRLSTEFLSRASQSLEAQDTDGARVWIDEAQAIGIDPDGVKSARASLTDQLVAMESAKRLPASELKIENYAAPVYPERALERGIQGWVDVEFTVGTDGSTRDVTVADASNDTYFGREAVTAVQKWRFEPRVFMGRPIEQRAYTRIRFVQ
jgi:TonB family protein